MGAMTKLMYNDNEFEAYVAEPKGKIRGAVLVIHEVWGLSDHIKSVTDRFAAEGYVALAPDLLAETDIAAHADELQLDLFDPKKRNAAQPKLRQLMAPMQEPGFAEKALGRLRVCFDELYDRTDGERRVAVVGFCFGGSYSLSLATQESRLRAAVPFYGHAPEDQDAYKDIACPVLAFYGEQDSGLVDDLPQLQRHMEAAGVDFTAKVYDGCGHAFFNDSNKFAYNEAAARDAWQLTLKFLSKNLS